ncbi:MAG: hypothetical protein MI743_17805, partial [Sneathiellales bacterium]|nr:hypothetical protein [Sneathiellales bacterium]
MRYMPHTAEDRQAMLERIGVGSVDELFTDIPQDARLKGLLDLPEHAPEMVVDAKMQAYGAKNLSPSQAPF